MYLRKLEDAQRMFEWMHDNNVVENLNTDFVSKCLLDCERFIRDSQNGESIHLAIVNDEDEYMGTVSLKHIKDNMAEFGIAIRTVAMGRGYSKAAMEEKLKKAFDEYGLETVYWCVDPNNKRALRFYDKNGVNRILSESLKFRGDTAKNRFSAISGIRLQRKNGGTVSNQLCPNTTEQYYFLRANEWR